MAKRRLRAVFHGYVQGVGFRFITRRIASQFNVTGQVRNCHNGTVELLSEGNEEELKRFLNSIGERMEDNIKKTEITWSSPEGKWTEFNITF